MTVTNLNLEEEKKKKENRLKDFEKTKFFLLYSVSTFQKHLFFFLQVLVLFNLFQLILNDSKTNSLQLLINSFKQKKKYITLDQKGQKQLLRTVPS